MYTFEAHFTSMQPVYITIKRYRNTTAPETMVQRMLDDIRVTSSLFLTMVKEHVLNSLMGDWLGATAHMLIKVGVHFPPGVTGKWKKGGDFFKISQAGKAGRGEKGGYQKNDHGHRCHVGRGQNNNTQ